jgi:hypothetical protein
MLPEVAAVAKVDCWYYRCCHVGCTLDLILLDDGGNEDGDVILLAVWYSIGLN